MLKTALKIIFFFLGVKSLRYVNSCHMEYTYILEIVLIGKRFKKQ